MAKFDLHKFLGLVQVFAPLVLSQVKGGEKIVAIIPDITNGIISAEQIRGATSEQKKAHVMEIVEHAVAVNNATNSTKFNVDEVKTVADNGIDAVVGTINIVEGTKVVKPKQ